MDQTMTDSCLERVLFPEEEIRRRVTQLGEEISRDYAGQDLLLLGVLRGAVVFLADLTRAISIPHAFDFIGVSSYRDAHSMGHVIVTKDVTQDLTGRHVLLIEDIYDTGLSLQTIVQMLQPHKPASVEVCAFLYKDCQRSTEARIKYVGIICAPEGVQKLNGAHPDVPIHLAAVDERLNEIGYIVPGLGDAGDRQFGTG
jgi:hypoxanthine phosphoribosyltransferase